MSCNLGVVGSNPTRGSPKSSGGYQSGQMGQTVNLLAYAYGGSNPSPPTPIAGSVGSGKRSGNCGSSSVGRALAFQAKGREFEPRLPLKIAYVAQG